MALCMICIVVASIIYLLIRLVKLITCRGIEECRNRKCVFNEICSKYDSRLTEEEANELYKLIDSMCEKNREVSLLTLLREACTFQTNMLYYTHKRNNLPQGDDR